MTRKILFLLFLIAAYGLVGQDHASFSHEKSVTDYKQKLDSLVGYNTLGMPFLKYQFTYNDDGNVIEDVLIFVSWNSKERTQFSYAETGELISRLLNSWDESTGQWIQEEKTEFNYSGTGLLTISIYSEWDMGSSAWIEDTKSTFAYDGEGKLTELIEYEWNPGTGEWVEDRKEVYYYYPNGNLDYQIDYDKWSSEWRQMWKHDYSYDDEKLITEIEFEFNYNLGVWDSVSKFEYTYDSYGNLASDIYSWWDDTGMQWIYNMKTEYQYNNNYSYEDLVLPISIEDWSWRFNNMLTEGTSFFWVDSTGTWSTQYEGIYYYSDHIPGSINEPDFIHFSLFPNPASHKLRVQIDGYQIEQITFYNLNGQKIKDLIPVSHELDISHLPPGMYIVEVMVDGRKVRKKLLVE